MQEHLHAVGVRHQLWEAAGILNARNVDTSFHTPPISLRAFSL